MIEIIASMHCSINNKTSLKKYVKKLSIVPNKPKLNEVSSAK